MSIQPQQHTESTQAMAAAVEAAKNHLLRGHVVLCGTETFYGLLARADDEAAVAKVLALKARPADKPLPLVVPDAAFCRTHCEVTAPMARLMQHFWPGPLTLVLPSHTEWPTACAAPLAAADSEKHASDVSARPCNVAIAVRVSGHFFVKAVMAATKLPLTATSANIAGAPPQALLADVALAQGAALTDVLAVDTGPSPGGRPSTLVAQQGGVLQILRPGVVMRAAVLAIAGG